MKKVGFVSLGCPKNLVDSEVMIRALAEAGFTNDAAEADTVGVYLVDGAGEYNGGQNGAMSNASFRRGQGTYAGCLR